MKEKLDTEISKPKSIYLSAKAIKKVKKRADALGRSFSYVVEQAVLKSC